MKGGHSHYKTDKCGEKDGFLHNGLRKKWSDFGKISCPTTGIADRGYRGKSKVNETRIVTPRPARKNASKEAIQLARKRFRRRAGIEPIIGHLKSDHRLKRNFLKGFDGDQINLLMTAAAFNFKKWMREAIFWPHYMELILSALVHEKNLRHA